MLNKSGLLAGHNYSSKFCRGCTLALSTWFWFYHIQVTFIPYYILDNQQSLKNDSEKLYNLELTHEELLDIVVNVNLSVESESVTASPVTMSFQADSTTLQKKAKIATYNKRAKLMFDDQAA